MSTLTTPESIKIIKPETLFALAGAGYAGADFLEGFVAKFKPK